MATTLTSFSLFPHLTRELRWKIWEEAILQSPRIVEIWQLRVHSEETQARNSGLQDGVEQAKDVESLEPQTETEEGSGLVQLPKNVPRIPSDMGKVILEDVENEVKERKEQTKIPEEPSVDVKVDGTETTELHDEEDSSDDESEYDEHGEVNENYRFTSPTILPPLLHVSQESRKIALQKYHLSFPKDQSPATIYYNPSVDILYFPAWCFRDNIRLWERTLSKSIKAMIQRIAIDNLVWYPSSISGTINGQIQIDQFPNLEEFLFITRNPDPLGCGCCHEFDGPDIGKVSFNEFSDNYYRGCLADIVNIFEYVEDKDKEWKRPKVLKVMQLMRNGISV